MATYLFISPHSDDIAFSLGAFLAVNKNSPSFNSFILTIFTKSNHSPYLAIRSVSSITEYRTNEDKSFARYMGAKYLKGGYPEGLLRGYKNIQSLYNTQTSATSDPSFDMVKNYVELKIKSISADFVFFPCSIGNHIEHRMLKEAGTMLEDVFFYEDLPYAADFDNPVLNKKHSETLVPLAFKYEERAIQEKLNCLSTFYPSQVSLTELDKIKQFHSMRVHPNTGFIFNFGNESLCYAPEIVWGQEETCQKLLMFLKEEQHKQSEN